MISGCGGFRATRAWDELYVDALARLMLTITPEELARHNQAVPRNLAEFDREAQVQRATKFFNDILSSLPRHTR